MKAETPHWVQEQLAQSERFWLFLDYDGTLADFAPAPDHVSPDPELVDLIGRLARHPRFRVAVVSGRRLGHVQELVPVPGVLLAGTYGVELKTAGGVRIDRLDYDSLRPKLDAIKPRWTDLIAGRQGFFLEDKGWALALHARYAADDEAIRVLAAARHLADAAVDRVDAEPFRLLGGHKFLEIGPRLAHKGLTVAYLLDTRPWPGALPIYLGDDDKDVEAFGVIRAHDGIAVVVSAHPRETDAELRLESSQAARGWLEMMLVDRG